MSNGVYIVIVSEENPPDYLVNLMENYLYIDKVYYLKEDNISDM